MAQARDGTQESDAMQRLARLAGVASSYRDAWGKHRHVPIDVRRALLSNMGFRVDTLLHTVESLRELELRPWRRSLPPVVIAREGEAIGCDLVINAADREMQLHWRIDTEQHDRLEGEVSAQALTVTASQNIDGIECLRLYLPVSTRPSPGYHNLTVHGSGLGAGAQTTLIVCPPRAYLPRALTRKPGIWGFAVQLYALRSQGNWGIGDYGDLRRLAQQAGERGASVLAINPLHTLFPGNPEHISPYGPSSRQFLNTAYIAPAPALIPEQAIPRGKFVEHGIVLPLKLRALLGQFAERSLQEDSAFRYYLEDQGNPLWQLALFQALSEHFGRGVPWCDWPAPYRQPDSHAVADFAREHRERIEFFAFLQWLADRQLREAANACRESGMALGLCRDLAVGTDRWGAETWSRQSLFATGASIGAPPDAFNLLGQNWGIPPINPLVLREQAYAPFIALMRSNMRHAGALRVDHILGWMRMYWVPEGKRADQGGYVRYPFDDLLAIAALESQRNRCVIVGEDLGTVPRGLRGKLSRTGILSTRVLYFERNAKGYRSPDQYPRRAVASVTTHDLPPLKAFLEGHDLQLRARHRLFASSAQQRLSVRERAAHRRELVRALQDEGLLPAGSLPGRWLREHTLELALAAYRFLARSRAGLVLVNFEDILELLEQVNLPGTVDEHPNWRRTLPLAVDKLLEDPRVDALIERLNADRPRPARPQADGKHERR